MTKKEYLTAFLDTLGDVRPEGQNIKNLIANDELADDILDEMVRIFQQAVDEVKDATKKEKLQQWLNFLEKLKQQEEQERKKEHQDLDALLAGIHGL